MLDLSENKIGTNGAIAIAEAIKQSKSLTTLLLRENAIGDAIKQQSNSLTRVEFNDYDDDED